MNEIVKKVLDANLTQTKDDLKWWTFESGLDSEIVILHLQKFKFAFDSQLLTLWRIGSITLDEYFRYKIDIRMYYMDCESHHV